MAAFCVEGDSIQWFYVAKTEAAFFVAAHLGSEMKVTVARVSEHADNDEYGLTEASIDGYGSSEWWSNMLEMLGYERAYKLFNALSDSLEIEDTMPPCDAVHPGVRILRHKG